MKVNPCLSGCMVLLSFAAVATYGQSPTPPNTPTSGAMLEIKGTVSSGANNLDIDLTVYDSQIHTGTVQVPALPGSSPASTCSSGDEITTDAYVLQAGAPTGCDPGDLAEASLTGSGTFKFVSPSNSAVAYEFDISTQYVCAPLDRELGACGAESQSNTNNSITSNDTGFLTVLNSGTSSFTGTVTLSGTPGNTSNCPLPEGQTFLTDSVLYGGESPLGPGGQAVLALSSDASACGGFNFDQVSQPMATSTQATSFLFGGEKFTVTPTNINVGDVLTFRPVPVPNGQFDLPGLTLPSNAAFGANQQCVSMADFSAPEGANMVNSVCPEIQTHCFKDATLTTPCSDAETFVWSGELDGHLDPTNPAYQPVSGVPEIGGVHFLGAPGVACLQNTFSEDIVTSYTGDSADDLPLKSGGSGLNCFVATFDPALTKTNPVGPGVVVSAFSGFKPPVVNSDALVLNPLFPIEPLGFQIFNGAGGAPITNLHWCPSPLGSTSPTGCGTTRFPIPKPWVAFSQIPLNAPGCPTANFSQGPIFGLLVNVGKGNYWFNWIPQLLKDDGCATVQVQFSFGTTVQPASFLYP